MKCGFSQEEDEIFTQILCKMKDTDLQKELWKKDNIYNNLGKVLGAIRASEVASESQTAAAGQAATGSNPRQRMKCYSCDRFGHRINNCPTKSAHSSDSLPKCGFCRGPKKCKM